MSFCHHLRLCLECVLVQMAIQTTLWWYVTCCSTNVLSIKGRRFKLQFFTWNSKHDTMSWWKHLECEIPRLTQMGFTQVWLPPPNKAANKVSIDQPLTHIHWLVWQEGRGYDAYDLVRELQGPFFWHWLVTFSGTSENSIKRVQFAPDGVQSRNLLKLVMSREGPEWTLSSTLCSMSVMSFLNLSMHLLILGRFKAQAWRW